MELTNNPKAGDELRLVRIAEVVGIENLEPRVPLEFGSANLSVIYGHNGSGKSSYTRILKKVSGKPRAIDLKTNVFKAAPPHSKCSITSQLNGVESSHEWIVGGGAVDTLRGIDIFDSDEASHYLTAESAATYNRRAHRAASVQIALLASGYTFLTHWLCRYGEFSSLSDCLAYEHEEVEANI